MRKFCIATLDFDMGTDTKQIFSIPPNPKQRKQRVYYEINNYCAMCRIKYPKGSYVQIASIKSEQQDGIVLKWQM